MLIAGLPITRHWSVLDSSALGIRPDDANAGQLMLFSLSNLNSPLERVDYSGFFYAALK